MTLEEKEKYFKDNFNDRKETEIIEATPYEICEDKNFTLAAEQRGIEKTANSMTRTLNEWLIDRISVGIPYVEEKDYNYFDLKENTKCGRDLMLFPTEVWSRESNSVQKREFYSNINSITQDIDLKSVSDGQQRITSLKLAFTGRYDDKICVFNPLHHRSDKDVDIYRISNPYSPEKDFVGFSWITNKEYNNNSNRYISCQDFKNWKDNKEMIDKWISNNLSDLDEQDKLRAEYNLNRLYESFFEKKLVKYEWDTTLEHNNSSDKFIMKNNLGKKLNGSDLIFSKLTKFNQKLVAERFENLKRVSQSKGFRSDNMNSLIVYSFLAYCNFRINNLSPESISDDICKKIADKDYYEFEDYFIKSIDVLKKMRLDKKTPHLEFVVSLLVFYFTKSKRKSLSNDEKKDFLKLILNLHYKGALSRGHIFTTRNHIYDIFSSMISEIGEIRYSYVVEKYDFEGISLKLEEKDLVNLIDNNKMIGYGSKAVSDGFQILSKIVYPDIDGLTIPIGESADHSMCKKEVLERSKHTPYDSISRMPYRDMVNSFTNLIPLDKSGNSSKGTDSIWRYLRYKKNMSIESIHNYFKDMFIPIYENETFYEPTLENMSRFYKDRKSLLIEKIRSEMILPQKKLEEKVG